jgi:hypothetical protein
MEMSKGNMKGACMDYMQAQKMGGVCKFGDATCRGSLDGFRYWGSPMALNPKNTWYVSFNTPPPGTPRYREVLRITKTFQTEAEAKKFARLKLAEGRIVIAGTINPHVPKRTIATAEIYRWLEMDDTSAG